MIRKDISCVVANWPVLNSFCRRNFIFRRMFQSDVRERDLAGICYVNSNVMMFIASFEIWKNFPNKEGNQTSKQDRKRYHLRIKLALIQ